MSSIRIFILLLAPCFLFAQEGSDYSVLLNSGKFTPPENSGTLSKNQDLFLKSQFKDSYYLMLQFRSLPGEALKAQLKANGVLLLDYIPNLAYTASVPAHYDLQQLPGMGIRSVFRLEPGQKTVPELMNGQWPLHAIKTPGFIQVARLQFPPSHGAGCARRHRRGRLGAVAFE